MTVSLKHSKTSPKVDGTDTDLVQPSDWNAEHTLTLAAGKVLGRASGAGDGAAQELPLAVGTDGTTVISTNSTTDALRITQTGSGNALVVEDSTNPDSTPFVVDASGNVGVGANLNLTGSGARITGDFSNATIANRLTFQTSTTNGSSIVNAIPNGTGTSAGFQVYNNSDPANAAGVRIQTSATESNIVSNVTGTGTFLPLTFSVGGSERVRIDTSGNVGVGTSAPSFKFDINGNVLGIGTTVALAGAGGNIRYRDDAGTVRWLTGFLGTASERNFTIYDIVNAASRVTIDTSGNVGIGTSSPGQRLHVVASDGVTNTRLAGASYAVRVQSIASVGASVEATSNTEATYQPLLVGGSQVQFTTSGAERARIDSSGNVGIGTSSPTTKLDVNGSISQNVVAVAASAIDCSAGNYFIKTATGALTWTVTNVPSSRAYSFILELTNGGTGTQTWFSGIKWPGGTAPTLVSSGVDVLGFITDDGGTTWRGVQLMKDSK